MIISHEHQFIFIHIQRTAGTSIAKSLCGAMKIEEWEGFIGEPRQVALDNQKKFEDVYFTDHRKKFEGKKHMTARDIKKVVGKKTWSSYFTFSFTRNPWDRILSSYLKRRKEFTRHTEYIWPDSKMLFNAAVLVKFGLMGWKRKAQTDYLTDESGNIIVDFVGKFENLEDDFRKVCSKVNLDAELCNNKDSTSNSPYSEYYYDLTKRVVEKHELKNNNPMEYEF